jgi:hypothetical protein
MKLALASDTHLDRFTYVGRPGMTGDAFYSFSQVVDFVLADPDVWALGLAGDLFNSARPDTHTLAYFFGQMDRLKAAGKPALFVQGQHELVLDGGPPWAALHPWPTHVDVDACPRRGAPHGIGPDALRVVGVDYRKPGRVLEAYERAAAGSVLLAHQPWREHTGGALETIAEAVARLPHKPGLVYTGDYHALEELQIGDTRILSTGSTAMRKKDEPPRKYFATYDPDRFPAVQTVCLRTRPWVFADLDEDVESLLATLVESAARADPGPDAPAEVRRPVWVVYSTPRARPAACQEVRTVAAECGAHLFLEPPPPVAPFRWPSTGVERKARPLEDVLVEAAGADAVKAADAVRLWRAADPAAEAKAIAQEAQGVRP